MKKDFDIKIEAVLMVKKEKRERGNIDQYLISEREIYELFSSAHTFEYLITEIFIFITIIAWFIIKE